MIIMKYLKALATPVVIGAFVVTAVTGTLMFFDLSEGYNKFAHEWIGMIFAGAGLFHVFKNWRAFKMILKRPMGMVLGVAGVALLAMSFMPDGDKAKQIKTAALVEFMYNARIDELATIGGTDTAAIINKLKDAGYEAVDGSIKLSDISGDDVDKARMVLKAMISK